MNAILKRYYDLIPESYPVFPFHAVDHAKYYTEADRVAEEFGIDVVDVYQELEIDDACRHIDDRKMYGEERSYGF